ncbi:MAG TPA: hypothetical protein VJI97_04380 [Candidatus Nanoarchaeia archaeon]|nr:hypothetical protein [Candidatus Nanoarchaeia archaeon]
MKKAQLYGHIFIYILTITVTSFILIYGYNAIKNFQDKTDQASCIKFRNDLKSAVYTIMSDYGTVKRKDIGLCSNYNKVCFVETYRQISDRDNPALKPAGPIDPIIKDSIKSGTEKNVFLVADVAKDGFYIGNITVEVGVDIYCVNAQNGKISLKLEGMGDTVHVSKWE